MFYYSVYDYEENTVLINDKFYTKEEFINMCKEAPLYDDGEGFTCRSSENIIEYLQKKYNFKELKYDQGFFVSGKY